MKLLQLFGRRLACLWRRSAEDRRPSMTSEVMENPHWGGYRSVMATATRPVGDLLREWRKRRHLSQLELALGADISTRHLSYVETGRAVPSREMVMHLAARLEVPLRDRNVLLLSAGYAPAFRERPLQDPALAAAREAVELVLAGHEPFPALAVDRHWTLVTANRATAPFLEGAGPSLLRPPVNVLRLSLHPEGLARRIINFAEWRAHVLARLQRQVDVSADPVLGELWRELADYPAPAGPVADDAVDVRAASVFVPLRISSEAGPLSFISTTTVFGTPVDVTLSELALETFFPADPVTGAVLRRLAEARAGAAEGS
jgi:transcriptional regulator with XRE-family HTH domain